MLGLINFSIPNSEEMRREAEFNARKVSDLTVAEFRALIRDVVRKETSHVASETSRADRLHRAIHGY